MTTSPRRPSRPQDQFVSGPETASANGSSTSPEQCPLCFGALNKNGLTDGVLHWDGERMFHERCHRVWLYGPPRPSTPTDGETNG